MLELLAIAMSVNAENCIAPTKQLVEAQEMQIVAGGSVMALRSAMLSPTMPLGMIIGGKEYLYTFLRETSDKYGLDYDKLYSVIQCESSFRTDVYGDKGLAFGIAQFHRPTFDRFCSGSYYSPEDQITCMAQMVKAGLGHHWTCWRNSY
jgi:hypothetical protein